MTEFTIISPAMFNLFRDCELKFYYQYIEQVPAPILDENFKEGKNIHNLASYYLKGYNVEKYEKTLSDREYDYWEYLKSNEYFKYEVLGVERSLSMKIKKDWIGGRIDAIVKNGEDYYILDYKTGGVYKDKTYDFQTVVYLLLCDKLFKKYNSLTFVYLDLKNKKEVSILFDKKLKTEYKKMITETCEKMKNIISSKTICNDKKCGYSKLCNVSRY